jgi:hypothetical protein
LFKTYSSLRPSETSILFLYLLGVLLGDGSLTNKKRNNIEISLGLNDEYVLNKLNLPKDCAISKSYVYNKNYIKTRIIRKVRAIESTIKKRFIGTWITWNKK